MNRMRISKRIQIRRLLTLKPAVEINLVVSRIYRSTCPSRKTTRPNVIYAMQFKESFHSNTSRKRYVPPHRNTVQQRERVFSDDWHASHSPFPFTILRLLIQVLGEPDWIGRYAPFLISREIWIHVETEDFRGQFVMEFSLWKYRKQTHHSFSSHVTKTRASTKVFGEVFFL